MEAIPSAFVSSAILIKTTPQRIETLLQMMRSVLLITKRGESMDGETADPLKKNYKTRVTLCSPRLHSEALQK